MVDSLGGAAGKARSLFSLDISTYVCDTTLQECGERFECRHLRIWFRVMHGRAVYTLVLVYLSIRLSKFRSMVRLSTVVTAQHSRRMISATARAPER